MAIEGISDTFKFRILVFKFNVYIKVKRMKNRKSGNGTGSHYSHSLVSASSNPLV